MLHPIFDGDGFTRENETRFFVGTVTLLVGIVAAKGNVCALVADIATEGWHSIF